MLELSNLSMRYQNHQVFSGVSVSIDPKGITALIGLNGSGKSSLLRLLMGLERISTGEITIDGKYITQLRPDERSTYFSLLDSSTRPVFSIDVDDLIKLGGRRHENAQRSKLFKEVVEGFELGNLLNRNALTLSSGEMQRTLLAHTLMGTAPITLLDEPFTHLDWAHQERSVQFLKNWSRSKNLGFLITLHELNWVPVLTERVLVLGQQKILASGPADQVFADERVLGEFAFSAQIDQNPLDGTKRLTLAKRS
jgi:ABC-type cobalamin/Fe3+-siderophores transport system ATPase subunit